MEDRKKGCGDSDIWHTTSAIARDAEDPSTGTDGSTAEDEHRVDSRAAEEKNRIAWVGVCESITTSVYPTTLPHANHRSFWN